MAADAESELLQSLLLELTHHKPSPARRVRARVVPLRESASPPPPASPASSAHSAHSAATASVRDDPFLGAPRADDDGTLRGSPPADLSPRTDPADTPDLPHPPPHAPPHPVFVFPPLDMLAGGVGFLPPNALLQPNAVLPIQQAPAPSDAPAAADPAPGDAGPPLGKRKRGRPRKSVPEVVAPVPAPPVTVSGPFDLRMPMLGDGTGLMVNPGALGQPAFVFPQLIMTPSATPPPPPMSFHPHVVFPKAAAPPDSAVPTDVGRAAKKPRSSHNEIEKRYRENINERMRELRDVVPALAAAAAEMEGADDDEGPGTDNGKAPAGKKLHKAAILKGATDHIRHLTAENAQLRLELDGLRALLTGVNPLPLSGWHAAPVQTADGTMLPGTASAAPFSVLILAGMLLFGGSGGVSDWSSFAGAASSPGGGHVDVGMVLGSNATAAFSAAQPLSFPDDGPFAWISSLLKVLVGFYCLLHIALSVFVFPRKSARATSKTAADVVGQSGQVINDSLALAVSTAVHAVRGDPQGSERRAGTVPDGAAGPDMPFPDGSLITAKIAHLRALRVASCASAGSHAAARAMVVAAVHLAVAGDRKAASSVFLRALDLAKKLPAGGEDLGWMTRDADEVLEFWRSEAWFDAVLASAAPADGTAVSTTVAKMGNSFRLWMGYRALVRIVGLVARSAGSSAFAHVDVMCRNLAADAQLAGDADAKWYLDVVGLLALAWSDASERILAGAVERLGGEASAPPLGPLAVPACVAIVAYRHGFAEIGDRAAVKAVDALSKLNAGRQARSHAVPATELARRLETVLEAALCASLASCGRSGSVFGDVDVVAKHLLRVLSVVPEAAQKDVDVLLPFVEKLSSM
ncbi:hypothetical protein DFJ74DRAFT_706838 [Hyaloraphidium curvatum]|nr:hypothetical protein DFJ74DRAFT_706838 [Hyaloraphidium curvatum]